MAKAEYRSAVRSRKLIKAALAELLQEKPLDKITVTEVVNRAQINRGTFYAHYSDIPDVIHQMVEEIFCRIRDVFDGQPFDIDQLPRRLLEQVRAILDEDGTFFREVMASHAANQFNEQLFAVVLDYLLEHEGDFPIRDHGEFEIKIRFCAGGLCQLCRDWLSGELNCTQEEFYSRSEALIRCLISA